VGTSIRKPLAEAIKSGRLHMKIFKTKTEKVMLSLHAQRSWGMIQELLMNYYTPSMKTLLEVAGQKSSGKHPPLLTYSFSLFIHAPSSSLVQIQTQLLMAALMLQQ
jgi:hypothetical protein